MPDSKLTGDAQHIPTSTDCLAQQYSIVAKLPPNGKLSGGAYFMAGSMAKLSCGTLVAAISQGRSHPQRGHGLDSIVVCNSTDEGATWERVAELPYDSSEPVLYVHQSRLYMFVTPNRREYERGTQFPRDDNARIWVSFTDDAGRSWSEPVAVLKGVPNYTSGGQTALLERDGRLYWTVSERYQRLAVVCCEPGRGIVNPDAWRVSELVDMPIPSELAYAPFQRGGHMRCLEGNVVEVSGRLLVISRAIINGGGTANMGAVFEIIDQPGEPLRLEFLQLYPIPGGQLKFYIQFDDTSGLYWMASNLPSNSALLIRGEAWESMKEDRRSLLLWYSVDSLNWFPAGWIARTEQRAQSFSYPVMLIDADDLLILSRTSLDSGDPHDVDMATFHRIRNFRMLAPPLTPANRLLQ